MSCVPRETGGSWHINSSLVIQTHHLSYRATCQLYGSESMAKPLQIESFVLVCSRNLFQCDFKIELWKMQIKCQISSFAEYPNKYVSKIMCNIIKQKKENHPFLTQFQENATSLLPDINGVSWVIISTLNTSRLIQISFVRK